MMSRILCRANSSGKRSVVFTIFSLSTRMQLSSRPPLASPSAAIAFMSLTNPNVRAGAYLGLECRGAGMDVGVLLPPDRRRIYQRVGDAELVRRLDADGFVVGPSG